MPEGVQAFIDKHFEAPERFLSGLEINATADLLVSSADVVLILDTEGTICDIAIANDELAARGCHEWMGKSWSDTVTSESLPKVQAMLAQSVSTDGVRWRHVNHTLPDGADLPLSYSVVPLRRDGLPGQSRAPHSVAFGRDLRAQVAMQQRLVNAQMSMERDYWRLRQVETRYRLLFQSAPEPVLILQGSLDKIEEANPAAYALFGEQARLGQWTLAQGLSSASTQALRDLLERLRISGSADPIEVQLLDGSQTLSLNASQFRQDNQLHFLLRFSQPQSAGPSRLATGQQQLLHVMEHAPDALVVTDMGGRILSSNRAFLEISQLASDDQARGQPLDKWLGRTGVDFRVLLSNLRQHGSVRLFASQVRGELGATTEVEISAVSAQTAELACLGFTIRDMGRRLTSEGRSKELPRSASQMTELVGRLPLRDIVRETTDLIELLCIQAALELTGDNRASAAEMLGLSRQSLYIKLRRFGIGESGSEAEH